MKESGYYPMGAEHDHRAPYNEVEPSEKEVEVTISVTLSKTVKIKVTDYEIIDSGKDEDGEHFEDIDYSNCDLKKAVLEQITLPQSAGIVLSNDDLFNEDYDKNVKDLSDWNVDDFEIVLD